MSGLIFGGKFKFLTAFGKEKKIRKKTVLLLLLLFLSMKFPGKKENKSRSRDLCVAQNENEKAEKIGLLSSPHIYSKNNNQECPSERRETR